MVSWPGVRGEPVLSLSKEPCRTTSPKHGAHPSSPQPSASPLDARDFHRYGLARDDDAYILDTFPIIQRQDEPTFNRYRTKDLILAYVNALAAGDTDATVTL